MQPPPVARRCRRPTPQLPKPTATHRAEVDPGSDIVGYVQKTIIGKEDTLPDIARRFDVGYEEILTANPGVDPWLPGVGREVVVPTQFVLPAAPHEGVVVNVAAMRIFYYPPHKKGEPQIGLHASHRHRQSGLEDSRGHHQDRQPPKGSGLGGAQVGARRTRRRTARSCPPRCPRDRTIRWASTMFRLRLAELLDPRNQQSPTAWACARVTAACACIPRTSRCFSISIPIGTKVTVVNQPYLFGWRDGTLYLQAYA